MFEDYTVKIKESIKNVIPRILLTIIQNIRLYYAGLKYKNLSNQEIFTKIYKEGIWGSSNDPKKPFLSGLGSRDIHVVSVYVNNIRSLLLSFETKPNIVDLGCGDFAIGSQIRDCCNKYIACDIVSDLIDYNKKTFVNLDVDFIYLDMVNDQLPEGEICFIRQVLQHLSNTDIMKVLKKLQEKYKYIIVTEHLPDQENFVPNKDKLTGPDTRLRNNSGIVLTASPFLLRPVQQKHICTIASAGGLIVTNLYQIFK